MRTTISHDKSSWIYRLDCKKLIIIAFLIRVIFASCYDIYCSISGRNILLPDSTTYSIKASYAAYLLSGYDKMSFTKDMIPSSREGSDIFLDILAHEKKHLGSSLSVSNIYTFFVGLIYLLLGHFTIFGRLINISLSMGGTWCLFLVARRRFGYLSANLFLTIALFMPTQFGYSLTLAKDFVPMFAISLFLLIFDRLEAIWVKN